MPVINLTFQTSDFARLALFMYLARQLSRKQTIINDFKKGFLPLIIPIMLTCLLIAPVNLSTAMLTGATGMLVIFLGRASMKHLFFTILIVLIPVVLLVTIVISGYHPEDIDAPVKKGGVVTALKHQGRIGTWMRRIQDFVYAKGDESPYQVQQAKIAIAKGGWFGMGRVPRLPTFSSEPVGHERN